MNKEELTYWKPESIVLLIVATVVVAIVAGIAATEDQKPALHKAFVAACEKTGGTAAFNSREWVCLK